MTNTLSARTHDVQPDNRDQPREPTANGLRKPRSSVASGAIGVDPLLTAEDVAQRLRVSTDWVWDHSSRKKPLLPVIRMGDGALRYRTSAIEAFIDERERLSLLRRRAS